MDKLSRHQLTYVPWPQYPYHPVVDFAIACCSDAVFLKYYVAEKFVKASSGSINGKVWEDSCVEFFLAFDENYYNLEFNCIGTALVGYGKNRESRELLPQDIVKAITFQSVIKNNGPEIYWEMTVKIPIGVFFHHNLLSIKGNSCRANFFKCGDGLPEPHYISWTNILSQEPDFHLPVYFGFLEF